MRQEYLCGISFWHPKWLQKFATTKSFLVVYGLLGTVQAMSYMYLIVTLTTIEKRFKIPSQTTGIVLSGNEISQVLLSLILSYAGGQRNRPRWIAWGIVFCGFSCFILALPHFIYGAGEEALQLTKEYGESLSTNTSLVVAFGHHLCYRNQIEKDCDQLVTIVPLILIFLSQFVLGIGNTLYYSLGQTYIDDNAKKTNTPLMLALAMALRLVGPIIGFQLGFASLNTFIDPTKTPVIDRNDPRWLGAWWLGWIVIGAVLLLFSGLVGMFPKRIPHRKQKKFHSEVPKALQNDYMDETKPIHGAYQSTLTLDQIPMASIAEFPKLKDFPSALLRLLKNKLLMFNIISSVFYILGAAGYMTFLTKYMEVQFHKTSQNATVLIGPVTIIGMVLGLVFSGLILTKRKPAPGKVLFWNVIVGFIFLAGQFSYFFLYCGDTTSMMQNGVFNTSSTCNVNCSCDGVPYSPVCHETTETTYFSSCHAGCSVWNSDEKFYTNCSCLHTPWEEDAYITTGKYEEHKYYVAGLGGFSNQFDPIVEKIVTTTNNPPILELNATIAPAHTTSTVNQEITVEATTSSSVEKQTDNNEKNLATGQISSTEHNPIEEQSTKQSFTMEQETATATNLHLNVRKVRSNDDFSQNTLKIDTIIPGACLKDCSFAFYCFAIVSMAINLFGSSGRVGNLLVNYRAVSTEDKSFAQGLALMLVSLFALIPGPIIFGWIIDQTCLVWTQNCNLRGHCQLYDQKSFRYYVNITALGLTAVGVVFDILVWYYGRHLDLYGVKEQERLKEIQRKNRTVKPLLSSTK